MLGTIINHGRSSGIAKVLVPVLVRPQARKEMQSNMTRLKARLEGHR